VIKGGRFQTRPGTEGSGRLGRALGLLLATVLVIGGFPPPLPATTEPVGEHEVAAAIREIVDTGALPGPRHGALGSLQNEMKALYAPTGYAPIWLKSMHPRPLACDAIDAIVEGGAFGLAPEDFDFVWLLEQRDRLASGAPVTPREAGSFDAALSLALMRQISARHLGRVDPMTLGVELDLTHKKVELAAFVRRAVLCQDVTGTVRGADSRLAQYRMLEKARRVYSGLSADSTLQPMSPGQKVTPGKPYADAGVLRRLLVAEGDLPPETAGAEGDDSLYTVALAEGVKRFQHRHGIWVDGVLGPATVAALNTPPAIRVHQIDLAMERLRWLPDLEDGPVIIVNIPAFRAWAGVVADTVQLPALDMNVVVGRAVKHETPLFTREMKYLVFRPAWNVPYEITRKEILPELEKDAGYLEKEDMELVRDFAQIGPSATELTPDVLSELARGTLKVRQRPGVKNSLGMVKFVFPNEHDIFMHDTPAKALFLRSRRDFSHGCIRVQDPARLATFVLAHNDGWGPERVLEAMHGTAQLRADLAVPVPVFIIYTTAYVEPDGSVHFLPDIYGHDSRLEEAIARARS
jgi:L,D-transpeptidase YcbB